MKHELQVRKLRKDVESECVCEDSKTRVYLSVMPAKEVRIQRRLDTFDAVTAGLRHFFGPVMTVTTDVILSVGVTMVSYAILADLLAEVRGGMAIGGEMFIGAAIGLATFQALTLMRGRGR